MIKEAIILILIVGGIIVGYQLITGNWNLNTITQSVSSIAEQNPLATSAAAIFGGPAVGAIGKLAYNSLKKEATETITSIQDEVKEKDSEIETLKLVQEEEVTKLKTQITELQQTTPDLTALQTEIEAKQTKIEDTIKEREAVEAMHTKFVNSLTSDTDTVIDPITQQIYKVIKIETVKVK